MNSRDEPLGVEPAELTGLIMTVAAYYPGDEAWAAGERWFRCDLVAVDGDRLVRLPTEIADVAGDGNPADRYAGCLRGENPSPISCTNEHDHEFAGAFKLDRAQQPAEADLTRIARTECNRIVGDSTWRATSPGVNFWDAGYTYLGCWRPV